MFNHIGVSNSNL